MSLRAKLPSTGALFIFESVARHQSFSQAAREFNITQPAVSRAIAQLERHLGQRLFTRGSAGVALSEAGLILLPKLSAGFDQIESALDEIAILGQTQETVTLSVSSAFAIHWLMPRFARLRADLPDVNVRIDLLHGEPEGPLGPADMGLRYNAENGPETVAFPLTEEAILPVASPSYREKHGAIDGPLGMAGHCVAALAGSTRNPWSRILPLVSGGRLFEAVELRFSDYALLLQAAIKGQAVALGWWHVVAHEMLEGGLVPVANSLVLTGGFYAGVIRRSAEARPAVQRLRGWLEAEFAALTVARDALGLEIRR